MGGSRVREVAAVLDPYIARIVAGWVVEIVPVLRVKVAVVAFAGTVTEAGTVRTLAMPPESVMARPPAGAALFTVTVHVVLEFEASDVAWHWTEEINSDETRERVTLWEEPLRVAVRVAD